MKRIYLYKFFLLSALSISGEYFLKAQKLIYQDIFHGGVTGGGFSTGLGSGSGTFNIYIEPGSTIRKAFLICNRFGLALDAMITLNGIDYPFNYLNQIGNNYNIPNSGTISASAVHAIDITNDIDSSITSYSVTIPPQLGNPLGEVYGSMYLIIEYENASLQISNSSFYINQQDMILNNDYWLKQLNAFNPLNMFGLSLHTDRICDSIPSFSSDGSKIKINNFMAGNINAVDNINNTFNCSGAKGHSYFQNSTLYGLDDDTPDAIMGNSDALANIQSYLGTSDTAINLKFKHIDTTSSTNRYNIYISFHLAYTTPCDTFSAGISQDTLMDLGDSTHLLAYGGYKYKWQPSAGLRCDTCANTIAKPDSSTLYTCTIYNNDSCTKVLPVKVNIYNNVGVEPIGDEIKINLYPNPTENNITLRHSSNSTLDFIITSIQGQELKKGMLYSGETEMDVSALSAGIYFIVIRGNGISRSLKFIKK